MSLINIAELPEGFLVICDELADKVNILDEIFGPRSVKGLHQLLPKLSQYSNPPEIRGDVIYANMPRYRAYMKALAYIFEKYKEEAT